MKKTFLKFNTGIILAVSALFPVLAHAQYVPQGGPDGKVLLFGFLGVLPLLPKIIFSLALVLFFLGVIHLFIAPLDFVPGFDKLDREKKSQSLAYMILALFIMFSIYGIIAMISAITGIGIGPSNIPVPNLPLDR